MAGLYPVLLGVGAVATEAWVRRRARGPADGGSW